MTERPPHQEGVPDDRFRSRRPGVIRTELALGSALATLTMLAAQPAFAQAAGVPDPANSSSTVASSNEAQSADTKKAENLAVTGDVAPAQNEANAQAAAATADTAADADIVVTGFRRSLENAVAEKKSRDQIVELISAEDIGKLPDASIAVLIARLPGLTSQRVSGRSQVISIRGFGPDFSTTLLNGREQTSTGGAPRGRVRSHIRPRS
ncbi:TonB-dependent receptor plug domain-containing protein [Sphingomonas sp. MMS24-JH45]